MASELLMSISKNANERAAYLSHMKFVTDLESNMANARKKGLAEGLAKGLAEGLVKGQAEGLVKGHAEGLVKGHAEGLVKGHAEGRAEEKDAVIRKLKALGTPPEMIVQVSEMPLEYVMNLK